MDRFNHVTTAAPALFAQEPPLASAAPSSIHVVDESSLMVELRHLKQTEPGRAIELAHEGNRYFPDSDRAPERTSILVHCLVKEGRSSEAHAEAEMMRNRFPDSVYTREVKAFTRAPIQRQPRIVKGRRGPSY